MLQPLNPVQNRRQNHQQNKLSQANIWKIEGNQNLPLLFIMRKKANVNLKETIKMVERKAAVVLRIKTMIMASVKSSRFPRIQLPYQILEALGITKQDAGKKAYKRTKASIVIPTRLLASYPLNAERLLAKHYDVHVVQGFVSPIGHARNVGAGIVDGEVLIFLDDDVEVDEGLLARFIEFAWQGYIIMVGGTHCVVIRHDIFDKVKFDEQLGWFEDYDFFIRAVNAGFHVYVLDYKKTLNHYGEHRWDRALKNRRIKNQYWLTHLVLRDKFFLVDWAKPEGNPKNVNYKRFFLIKNPYFLLIRLVGFFSYLIMGLQRRAKC